jgi:Rrf2 family protein
MFSKSCTYGIRAVLYLEVEGKDQKKIGVKEIAEALNIPFHFLAKILQLLSKHGIISSSKGPGGGFYLNEENKKRPLLDIIQNIDGDTAFTSCILGMPECCDSCPCPLHVQAFAYREGLKYQISHITIEEMAEKVLKQKLVI